MSDQGISEPKIKDNYLLEEIADAIVLLDNPHVNKYADKKEVVRALKEGKLVVSIMSNGAIKYPSAFTNTFLEFDEQKRPADYKICNFFASYYPKIENGQITSYERIKKD